MIWEDEIQPVQTRSFRSNTDLGAARTWGETMIWDGPGADMIVAEEQPVSRVINFAAAHRPAGVLQRALRPFGLAAKR
jgi:hypothetical protein